MLEAYLDESERSVDISPRVFAMAGWLGSGSAWRDFEPRWQAVLHDPEFNVSEFKSSDCAKGNEEFRGWLPEKRDALIGRLLDVISEADITGVVLAASLDETRGRAKRQADYLACAHYCMVSLASIAKRYVDRERIAFIFDERQKVAGELEALRKRIKGNRGAPKIAARIGPATSDSSAEIIPLQAADLLAYGAYLSALDELQIRPDQDHALTRVIVKKLAGKVPIRRVLRWEPDSLASVSANDPWWKDDPELFDLHVDIADFSAKRRGGQNVDTSRPGSWRTGPDDEAIGDGFTW